MNPSTTTIDDILHPGERSRAELAQLDAQIAYIKALLKKIEADRAYALKTVNQVRSVTGLECECGFCGVTYANRSQATACYDSHALRAKGAA